MMTINNTNLHTESVGWDSDEIKRRVDAAISSYEREAEQWATPIPEFYTMSRNRLPRLVELKAPDFIIANEIKLLQRRIAQIQSMRLGVSSLKE